MPPRLTISASTFLTMACAVHFSVFAQNEDAPERVSGRALLAEAREELGKLQSVRAKLSQTIAISARKMRAEGTYLRGGDDRVRLEFSLPREGSNPPAFDSYVQISDGQVSWRTLKVGEQESIERCNLQAVRDAIADEPRLERANWRTDLGIGGLKSMLASFEKLMDFSEVTEKNIDGKDFLVITGRWNAKSLSEKIIPGETQAKGPVPGYVPDYVRIYFDSRTKFPRRLLYLKRHPSDAQRWRPIVTVDFTDVVLNAPVDASSFQYTPPENSVPTDTTPQFIGRLKEVAGVSDEAESTDEAAAKP